MTHGENERLVKKLATQALGLLATASGIATTLVLAIGNAPWAAAAFAVELERGYHPARRSHLLVEDAGRVVIVSGAALATAYRYVPLAVFLAWIVAADVSGSAE
jgi:hypothetical protein